MRIEITRVTDWQRVVDAARFTVRKKPLGHEPSDGFKKAIIFAEHSPIRLLEFDVKLYDAPKFVINHLIRHNQGIEKFVATSRPDRTGNAVSRHEQRADDLVNAQFSLNAQALINISRVRLCAHAEKETMELWEAILEELRKIEPILAAACVKTCIYRGICPELKTCGYSTTAYAKTERWKYLDYFNKKS